MINLSQNFPSKKPRAILVEAVMDRREGDHLAELTELATVAGYEVIDRITQNIEYPNPKYLFGTGKVKEIKGRRKTLEADIIIIENNLDPIQFSELRKVWRVDIIDRFELILEIFIKKAGTKEALTQIRLAALKKMGGSRLEQHKSVVERNKLIKKLEKKLAQIKKAKDIRRKRRVESGFDLIAIAGYTNAGKSTLMNTLTSSEVEISGRMFTTLSTTTRSMDTLGRKILVTDTVGFISRLPHVLMDAFYATLKEIKEADLVLLLIDCNDSEENIKRKVLASVSTLTAIGAESIPLIPVLNKSDIASKIDEKIEVVKAILRKNPILISAKKGEKIDVLQEEILKVLETYKFHIKVPNTNDGMSFISKLHDKTRMTFEEYYPKEVELKFETNARLGLHLYNLIQQSDIDIDILNKETLENQIKKKQKMPEEDTITVLKTESGEEIIILDLTEEESENKKKIILPDDINSKTSI